MIRMYFDADATQVIRDSVNPTEGQPDYYEGPGEGGEVTAMRYLFNPSHATDRFEDVSLTAYQDDDQMDIKYALDDGNGDPVQWLDTIQLPDGDYSTPLLVHVKVIFAPTSEPRKVTHIKHWIQAGKRFLK